MIKSLIKVQGNQVAISSEANVTIVYETDNGGPRVIQKIIQLPLRLLLTPCLPENQASFSATIKCTGSLVNFSQLFPGWYNFNEKEELHIFLTVINLLFFF